VHRIRLAVFAFALLVSTFGLANEPASFFHTIRCHKLKGAAQAIYFESIGAHFMSGFNLEALRKALDSLGASKEQTKLFQDTVSGFLHNGPRDRESQHLREFWADGRLDRKAALCINAAGCKMTINGDMEATGLLHGETAFDVWDFEWARLRSDSRSIPFGRKFSGWKHDVGGIVFVKLDHIMVDKNPEGFFDTFFHEVKHAANRDRLERWIDANLKLLEQKRRPDPLFSRYVRLVQNSKYGSRAVLHKFFYYVFEESTANLTGLAATSYYYSSAGRVYTPEQARSDEESHRGYAKTSIDATVEPVEVTPLYVSPELGTVEVATKNIFEVGKAFSEQIDATIDRAGLN
jgi:hypothetical protein